MQRLTLLAPDIVEAILNGRPNPNTEKVSRETVTKPVHPMASDLLAVPENLPENPSNWP